MFGFQVSVLSVLTFSSLCSFEKSRIPRSIGELERRIFWIFEKFSFKMTLLSVIRREEEDRFKHRCVLSLPWLSSPLHTPLDDANYQKFFWLPGKRLLYTREEVATLY